MKSWFIRTTMIGICVAWSASTACNHNQRQNTQDAMMQNASEILGAEEHDAREKLDELSKLVRDGIEQNDNVPQRVEQFLEANRDDLVRNTRALEAKLHSMQDPERAEYEEILQTFMRPSVEHWSKTQDLLRAQDRTVARAVDRALKSMMNRNTQPVP